MNKLLLVISGALLISACTSVPNKSALTPLDLTADKAAVDEYWLAYRKVTPVYPTLAKQQKLSGCVEFSLLIDANGRAVAPAIIKSFPKGVFEKQATIAIEKWVWVPTQTNTKRQPVMLTFQHDFVVRQSSNSKAAYDACKI